MLSRSALWAVTIAVVAAVVLVGGGERIGQRDERARERAFSPFELLAASADESFARVESPWTFAFPADHGRHGQYRTESWHVTGVLDGDDHAPLAVQFLVVRIALKADPPEHASSWASSEIYAALLSISDPDGGRLHTATRVSRAAMGLAGTAQEPIRIWVEDWRLQGTGGDDEALDFRMNASTPDLALELELHSTRELVDTHRISERYSGSFVPFQFYTQPRLAAQGTIRVRGEAAAVDGLFSMEHAWGELPLPGGPVARDRFTLYLDDGRVLFGVRSHRADGSGTPETTGLLVSESDPPVLLSNTDIEMSPEDHWTSPDTGTRYPVRWTLRVPGRQIEADLTPYSEDQEGFEWMPFWSGAVRVRGSSSATSGRGVVQLNGYESS